MLINKIKRLCKFLFYFNEFIFNKNIITREKYTKVSKINFFPKGENYWISVASEISRAADLNNGKYFFLNKTVILHLASQNSYLGYRLLDKIRSHFN